MSDENDSLDWYDHYQLAQNRRDQEIRINSAIRAVREHERELEDARKYDHIYKHECCVESQKRNKIEEHIDLITEKYNKLVQCVKKNEEKRNLFGAVAEKYGPKYGISKKEIKKRLDDAKDKVEKDFMDLYAGDPNDITPWRAKDPWASSWDKAKYKFKSLFRP